MIKPIRLLAIIEAATITGPAKNLLQFARLAGSPDYSPPVEVSIAFFQRPGQSNIFLETAQRYSIPIYPIPESGRFDRAVLDGLNALVDRVQPDLIQSHAVKSHFLVRQSGLNRRAGWIAFHGDCKGGMQIVATLSGAVTAGISDGDVVTASFFIIRLSDPFHPVRGTSWVQLEHRVIPA